MTQVQTDKLWMLKLWQGSYVITLEHQFNEVLQLRVSIITWEHNLVHTENS